MSKQSLIRTIYLYLFALLGLVLLTIGGVMIIELGLKMTIFNKADVDRLSRPIMAPMSTGKVVEEADFVATLEKCNEEEDFTEEDKELVQSWLADYSQWKQQEVDISYTTQQRQRQASRAVSLILIGLPLYLYHWTVIKREIRRAKA